MRNAGLDEAQAGIKISGRNINTSDRQMTPSLWQKAKRTRGLSRTLRFSCLLVAQRRRTVRGKQVGGGDAKKERDERGICVDLRPIHVEVWQQTACRRPRFDSWVGKILWKKEMAIHSSILAWRIPWTEEPVRLQSIQFMGSQRVGHNWATNTSTFLSTFTNAN